MNLSTIKTRTASWVCNATPYRPPAPDPRIDLRLDANEGSMNSTVLQSALQNIDLDSVCRYPDKSKLESLIANRLGVSDSKVVVTSGGDDAIDRTCRTFLEPEREVVIPSPTFAMIPKYAAMTGCSIRQTDWSTSKFPTNKVIELCNESTGLIVVVSPNNPTGLTAAKSDIESLSRNCLQATILLDHAYVEFADEDLTTFACGLPNVVVIRTFSKAWGMAGLRVGYAVGNESLIQSLRCACNPFPVSSVSLAIAATVYEKQNGEVDPGYTSRVRYERNELESLLNVSGTEVTSSQANFVFARMSGAKDFVERIAAKGIAIRSFETANSIRVTCPGDEADFERLRQTIKEEL